MEQQGTVVSTITWEHSDPDHPEYDPPPPYQYIKETASAELDALGFGSGAVSGTVSNGFGDPTTSQIISDIGYQYIIKSSAGTHVHRVDTSSGIITTTCSFDGSIFLTSPVGDWDVQFWPDYQVNVLGVFLISSSIDASFHFYDLTDPSDNGINVRDPSTNAITGDSVAYWNNTWQRWEGAADYTAANIGFDSPTWDWVPGGDTVMVSGQYSDPQSAHYTFDLGSTTGQQDLGKTTTTKCTLTDSSGVTADNTYTARWHLPIEDWSEYQPAVCQDEPQSITVDSPGYAIPNGGIGMTWNDNQFWGDVGGVLNIVSSFTPNPVYSGLFSVAGLVAGNGVPQPIGPAIYSSCWDDNASTFSPSKMEDQKGNYHMVPVLIVPMKTQFWEGKGYGGHGYIGTVRKATKKQYQSERFIGIFTLYKGGDKGDPND